MVSTVSKTDTPIKEKKKNNNIQMKTVHCALFLCSYTRNIINHCDNDLILDSLPFAFLNKYMIHILVSLLCSVGISYTILS